MPKSAEQANKALVLEAFETNVLGTLLSLKHELRLMQPHTTSHTRSTRNTCQVEGVQWLTW
jgi:hypothetical protein